MKTQRGHFGIGVYHPKTEENIGSLWRSAYLFGADYVFTIGRRYKRQASDTPKSYKHIPVWNFDTFDHLKSFMPFDTRLVCIELDDKAKPLHKFLHPERAIYLLGAEDYGIPKDYMKDELTVQIQTERPQSMNVACAGGIILYDRYFKSL